MLVTVLGSCGKPVPRGHKVAVLTPTDSKALEIYVSTCKTKCRMRLDECQTRSMYVTWPLVK